MKKIINGTFCIGLLFVIGCSHIRVPFIGKDKEPAEQAGQNVTDQSELETNEFVVQGRIIDPGALKNGGNVAVVPFTAGVGAEATPDLDRAALSIVKGVSEALTSQTSSQNNRFRILTAENADRADLVLKGHIIKMSRPSKVKRWLMFKTQRTLSAEGRLIDTKSGNTVLVFNDSLEPDNRNEPFSEMGRRMGINIGRYILSGVE